MKLYLYFFSTLILILWVSSVYATEAPINLRVLESSDTTISLDWEDVSWGIWYYLYYGTQSGINANYEVELVDMIEQSEYTIEWLMPETSYYIAVSTMDDFWVESPYSEELKHTTLASGSQSEAASFRIQGVDIIDRATLELQFSKKLNIAQSSTQAFLIEEKKSRKEMNIDIFQVNEDNTKNVLVLLASDLQENTEYRVSVLDINDEQWNTIESWIDAFIEFKTPDSFEKEVIQENTEVNPWKEDESTSLELNAAGPSWENIELVMQEEANNAWTTLSQSEIDNTTTQTAQSSTHLPQTGPAHWLLLSFSLLLSAAWYIVFNRKTILKK